MHHHLRHLLGDAYGVGSGLFIWAVGVMERSPTVQYVGAFVGVGMLGVGVSREIREWTRPRHPDRGGRA